MAGGVDLPRLRRSRSAAEAPSAIAPANAPPSGSHGDTEYQDGEHAHRSDCTIEAVRALVICVSLLGSGPRFHNDKDRWPDAVDTDAVARFSQAMAGVAVRLAGA